MKYSARLLDIGSDAKPCVLVVGGTAPEPGALSDYPNVHFCRFEDLSGEMIHDIQPDVVLSALVADSFDALDLAALLVGAGFVGSYRAVAGSLPDPELVIREVRAICPGLDFRVLLHVGEGRIVAFNDPSDPA